MKKRLAMLLLSGAMVMTSLTGCGELKDSDVVATVGETEITADVANFFARYLQVQYESGYGSYLGEDMWSTEAEKGKTYEDVVKEGLMDQIQKMYLMEEHKDDYGVALSEEEETAIHDAAVKFDEANAKEDKEKVSGSVDTVERYLTLMTISQKVETKIREEADTEVSDEEAAQKKLQYVFFPYSTTNEANEPVALSDEEKADLKAQAEAFAAGAKDAEDFAAYATEQGYEAKDATFDSKEEMSIPKELVEVADAQEVGDTTDVIENENGCYVSRLISLFDEEATAMKKQEIVQQRQADKVDEVVKSWKKDIDVKVNDKVWDKISFEDLTVTMKMDEQQVPSDVPVEEVPAEEVPAEEAAE